MEGRYEWSRHDSQANAEAALEDDFAQGAVSEGEKPEIEKASKFYGERHQRGWLITLAG